ncbi:MAG: hypothetical protein KF861_21180 [Planctomycetaceae bacterium]|nr:hypothetical protein [Planctomycetaceae bacterium]
MLSDLLGQQTNLWGHMPTQPHSLQEVAEYREQLSRQQLQPLDEAIIGWYLRYAWEWETQIMAASDTPTRVHVIYYEDLFSPQLPMSARLQCFCTLAAKLGVQLNPQEPRVQTILHSDAKLNTSDTLARIPNYREISERWGSAEFWPGAATPTGGR